MNEKLCNSLLRYIQIELFDTLYDKSLNDKQLDKSFRFIELCAMQLALGMNEFSFKELAKLGMLCPNDWDRFEIEIKREIPEATSYKYLKKLYKK